MYKALEEIIKKLTGNVLVMGLDDSLLKTFNTNKLNSLYSIETKINTSFSFKKKYKLKTSKGNKINIKKLKRRFKKKSYDYTIYDIDTVLKYYKYIIRDTIYLTNKYIYVFSKDANTIDLVKTKYERYNVKIEKTQYKTGYILKINNTNGKNNFVKDKIYFISDTLSNIADQIGNILIS